MRIAVAMMLTAIIVATACVGDADDTPPAGDAPPRESLALGDNAGASCAEAYSLETLKQRAFAFDGTVTAIEPPASTTDPEVLIYGETTFEVHEWLRADGPDRVTIQMDGPVHGPQYSEPDYAIGSRLLITGEPRWDGAPLDQPVAWYCSFSRTYDAVTADAWRVALN